MNLCTSQISLLFKSTEHHDSKTTGFSATITSITTSAFIGIGLLVSVMVFRKHETAAYVLCVVCELACVYMFSFSRHPLISEHLMLVCSVTLYQFYYQLRDKKMPWWLEIFVSTLLLLQYAIDSLLAIYMLNRTKQATPHSAKTCLQLMFDPFVRDEHVMFSYRNFSCCNLIMWALIPFPRTGLFQIHEHYTAALFTGTWVAVMLTDMMRNNVLRGGFKQEMRANSCPDLFPPTAAKCAPLLYMDPYVWIGFGVVILVNAGLVILSVKEQKKIDAQQ